MYTVLQGSLVVRLFRELSICESVPDSCEHVVVDVDRKGLAGLVHDLDEIST